MGVGIEDSRYRTTIDGEALEVDLTDLSSTTLRTADATFSPDMFMRSLSGAVGVVLLYDITSLESFDHITRQGYMYACMCNNYMGEKGRNRIREYILIGNKKDIVEKEPKKRQVDEDLAEQWAQSQGMQYVELSTHSKADVDQTIRVLMRSIMRAKERDQSQRLRERNNTTTKSKIKQVLAKLKSST
jgi:GTPase involved in cell partitioning and DNA repair